MSEATRYSDALEALQTHIATELDDPTIDPRCVPLLLHHGHRTTRTIVLFHGFTNCPRQYAVFAQLLFRKGFTVYVPRLPRHGLLDKETRELAGLTVDELTMSATTAFARVADLGEATSTLGLSLGATMVSWLAQTQAVERAIVVSPFFSVAHVPSLLEPAMAAALLAVPNVELWWDPRHKADVGPAHGYPRFPTHALGHCLRLGELVREAAANSAPKTSRVTLVLNSRDPAIDNAAAHDVWRLWQTHAADVGEYTFDNLDARHDIIEPQTYRDAVTLVYPVLLRLLDS